MNLHKKLIFAQAPAQEEGCDVMSCLGHCLQDVPRAELNPGGKHWVMSKYRLNIPHSFTQWSIRSGGDIGNIISTQSALQYCLTITHSFTHSQQCQPCKAPASSSGAVRVRYLAHGHLDTQLGGAGDQTSNLAVTSQPAVPPELLPNVYNITRIYKK